MADVFKAPHLSDEIVCMGAIEIKEETTHDACQIAIQLAFDQGFSEGVTAERTALANQTQTLHALLQSLPATISDHRQHLSTEIADIVLIITQQLFINQQHDKTALGHQINQIITQLNDQQHLDIALHPQDLALLQQGQVNLNLSAYKNLRFRPDEQLRLGGFVIKTEHGVFDAGIERQIDRLKQVLLEMKQG